MFVFLAIRGLGKVKAVVNSLPKEDRSPERAVLQIMTSMPNLVPSVAALSSNMVELIRSTLTVHSSFNLGQLIQGENVPSHISILQKFVLQRGEELLKFYLFSLVCIMSGILGSKTLKGSLFMD